jgi:hypothetical protein
MISGIKERYGNIRLPPKFVLLVDDDIKNKGEDDDDEPDDNDQEAGTICTFFHSDEFI